MLRWDDLGVLLAVHRHPTLAAAGASLGVDASTVSRRLRALEQDLGARLFDRTPDGLVATDLALRLLPHAEQAEAAALAAQAEAEGAEVAVRGLVRVALADAFAAYVVAPQLPELLDAWPGLRVELVVGTEVVDLGRREADIAVRFVRPQRGDLLARRAATSGAYRGWVSERYVARYGVPEGLPAHWIGWSERRAHLPEARLYERLVGQPPRMACDELVVMMEAWRAGCGALLMPEGLARLEPGAIPCAPGPAGFEVELWLVVHRALRRVPRVDVVWRWLEERIASL